MNTLVGNAADQRDLDHFVETLGDSSADGVYAVDDQQRIVYWSHAAEVLTGRAASDVRGRHCFDVMLGGDYGGNPFCRRDCPTMVAARRGRAVPSYDLGVQTADGRQAWFNISIVALKARARGALRVVHMFRDVTARRRAEVFADRTVDLVTHMREAGPNSTAVRASEPPVRLTTRELEVLRLLGQGLSTEAIAARLSLSKATVRNHMDRLRTKLGAHNWIEVLVRAGQMGIA